MKFITGIKLPRYRHRAMILWLMLFLLGAMLSGFVAMQFSRHILTIDSGNISADAAVVLGGGSDQLRPQRAAELFLQGKVAKIVVSGTGDYRMNVLALRESRVPLSAITVEGDSISTLENARFSIALLRKSGAHRVIIVTSWYHSRRALACFEHIAPDMQFYSCPSYWGFDPGEWKSHRVGGYVAHEYVKLLGYWVRYGVCPLFIGQASHPVGEM